MTRVDQVIAQAERWLGTVEQPPGSNRVPGITDWYGISGPWCAMAVSRWFFDAGLPLPASTPKGFAYTPAGAAWFRNQGRWKTSKPQRGDVVFFDFPNDGVSRISHVGVVTGVRSDGTVETIEGNTDERGGRTGGKVMRQARRVGIVGYGRPDYSTEVRPMFDPAHRLLPIVASLNYPLGGALLLAENGALYAYGCPNNGAPDGKKYFEGRRAARLEYNPRWEEAGRPEPHKGLPWYVVVATSGEPYGHGGF